MNDITKNKKRINNCNKSKKSNSIKLTNSKSKKKIMDAFDILQFAKDLYKE